MKYKKTRPSYLLIFCILMGLGLQAQTNIEKAKADIQYLLKAYSESYVDTLRGLTKEQWSENLNQLYAKIDQSKSNHEIYYAFRYSGKLLNDNHIRFVDNYFYNRRGIFRKTDSIFPVWTKTWKDGSMFVVKDYCGQLPVGAQILSVNGYSVKAIGKELIDMNPGETRTYSNLIEGDTRAWMNLTNYLFCERITAPYLVEYLIPNDTTVHTSTLYAMSREDRFNQYKKDGNTKKVNRIRRVSGKPITYCKINNVGVLDINLLWGKNPFSLMFSSEDARYCKLLHRAMKQVAEDSVQHLIIDIRDNPGGYNGNISKTIDYLSNEDYDDNMWIKVSSEVKKAAKPLLKNVYKAQFGKTEKEKVAQSIAIFDSMPKGSLFSVDTLLSFTHKSENLPYKFKGKVYVLTNAESYSASIWFCNRIKELKIGKLVGEAPGGYSIQTGGPRVTASAPNFKFFYMNIPYTIIKSENKTYEYLEMDDPIEQSLTDWLQSKDTSLEQLIQLIEQSEI